MHASRTAHRYRVARTSPIARGRTFRPPPLLTALWGLLALAVPVYRALPTQVSNGWLMACYGLIVVSILLALGSKPYLWGVWFFAGFAALASGVTSSAASGLSATMAVAVQLFVVMALGPFAVRGAVTRDSKFGVRVIIPFLAVQSVSASAAVLQLFGFEVFGYGQITQRSPGLAGHPNILGVMASLAVLICLWSLLRNGSSRKGVHLGCLLLNAFALVSTGSLSSMSACLLGALVLLWSMGFRVLRIAAISAIAVLITWFVLSVPAVALYLKNPLERFEQVTGQTEAASTLAIRAQTYNGAWAYLARDPLLGRGLAPEDSAAIAEGTVVHSFILRGWYQGGILLGIAFLLIVVAVTAVTIRSIFRRKDALPVGVLAMMFCFALTSAFFEQMYYWLPVLLAWSSIDRASPRRVGSLSDYGRRSVDWAQPAAP